MPGHSFLLIFKINVAFIPPSNPLTNKSGNRKKNLTSKIKE
jgi:hypothetical protein